MRAQITFKSGAQIEVDVDDIATYRNNVTKALTKLEWETPEDYTAKLHTCDIDEIVAIVTMRRESEPAEVKF